MSHSMVFFSDLKSSRCSSVVEARLLRSPVLGGKKYRELMWVDMLFLDVNVSSLFYFFFGSEFDHSGEQLKNKDEDRVVKNNEGLPQPFLGSCNDRARQLQASSSGVQSPGGSKESDPVKLKLFPGGHSHWLRGLREETQLHFRKKDKAAIVQSTNAVEKVAKSSSKRAVSIMPTQVMEVELDKATNLTAVETPVIFIARPQLKLL
ncbi:hypothetical protein Rs2_00305 [Raphanus sativus]|nr:hypothetical protein Rs2_46981 [Raphanus sativus]KAJ4899461.1 Uncharacterized protein Rs2_13412 [Raphanus sativus]KAJ4904744.1 Uncharacterized protein Rs2_18695 [Raphanus sativus]KAJ4913753.1 hypothetical protein Rs2_08374 [Raphanus sativus]KAJ4914755.1 hypothetical protein Rs2_00305 [Raphanus sativus]